MIVVITVLTVKGNVSCAEVWVNSQSMVNSDQVNINVNIIIYLLPLLTVITTLTCFAWCMFLHLRHAYPFKHYTEICQHTLDFRPKCFKLKSITVCLTRCVRGGSPDNSEAYQQFILELFNGPARISHSEGGYALFTF